MSSSTRLHRAIAIIPLAVLSAAWTANLAGVGVDPASADPDGTHTLPDGTVLDPQGGNTPPTGAKVDNTMAGTDGTLGTENQLVKQGQPGQAQPGSPGQPGTPGQPGAAPKCVPGTPGAGDPSCAEVVKKPEVCTHDPATGVCPVTPDKSKTGTSTAGTSTSGTGTATARTSGGSSATGRSGSFRRRVVRRCERRGPLRATTPAAGRPGPS